MEGGGRGRTPSCGRVGNSRCVGIFPSNKTLLFDITFKINNNKSVSKITSWKGCNSSLESSEFYNYDSIVRI